MDLRDKIQNSIKKIIDVNKKDALLFLHLEEIYQDTKYVWSLIDKIIKNNKISPDELHTILIELKVTGNHLRDHINSMQRPNEAILAKLDKLLKKQKEERHYMFPL